MFPDLHVGIQVIRPDKIARPSDMIEIGDASLMESMDAFAGFSFGSAFIWSGLYDPALVKAPLETDRPQIPLRRKKYAQRHGGAWNMAFIDGHLEGNKPSYF